MVISELVLEIASMLETENARFEAELMVMKAAGLDRTGMIINGHSEAALDITSAAFQMAKRRNNGEPVQYIIGTAEFMSLEFEVNKYTLIPRQDTETLVEYLIEKIGNKNSSILDIGTGTGCIGISLAHYCKNSDVTLLDVSENALDTARKNANRNSVRINFAQMNILEGYPDKKFDVIVSNPPYIETEVIQGLQTEVKDYEPVLALDGGSDGLIFYRRICKIAPLMLNCRGRLAFEIGYNQGCEVMRLMEENGFSNVEIVKDLCGNDRVVSGIVK